MIKIISHLMYEITLGTFRNTDIIAVKAKYKPYQDIYNGGYDESNILNE